MSDARARSAGIFHNHAGGHYANLMIKYLVGCKIASRVPTVRLSGFEMPYWGVSYPHIEGHEGLCIEVRDEQHIDVERIAYLLNNRLVGRVNWTGYGQRMEYFPRRQLCRELCRSNDALGQRLGDNDLVCPVRGGEILDARHGGYTLVPAQFYRDIADTFGLRPVFMGQTEPNPYTDILRAVLPDAVFLPSEGALADFETIRHARNIVVPVSTFAWLAAFLSYAQRVVMPVFGLYHRGQFPQNDLLPLAEADYHFYQFPVHWAVPVGEIERAHAELAGQWHRIDPLALAAI